jgi:glycosyltransferase involved in cell wall biosynthesis
LVALYNLADVFVYPSLYEGFGLPVVEAMACGTPVITSNVSSLPEVAGDAAVFIDPRSEMEISTALEHLIDDPDLRTRLRTAGLSRAKKFSWRSTAEQTIEGYRRCL